MVVRLQKNVSNVTPAQRATSTKKACTLISGSRAARTLSSNVHIARTVLITREIWKFTLSRTIPNVAGRTRPELTRRGITFRLSTIRLDHFSGLVSNLINRFQLLKQFCLNLCGSSYCVRAWCVAPYIMRILRWEIRECSRWRWRTLLLLYTIINQSILLGFPGFLHIWNATSTFHAQMKLLHRNLLGITKFKSDAK